MTTIPPDTRTRDSHTHATPNPAEHRARRDSARQFVDAFELLRAELEGSPLNDARPMIVKWMRRCETAANAMRRIVEREERELAKQAGVIVGEGS